MSKSNNTSSSIVTVESLKSFFFKELEKLNQTSLCPVPNEALFYSSGVLEKFCVSDAYFDVNEGKVREKILGQELLKAPSYAVDNQKRIYRDIGDTALFLCGFFNQSLNSKLVDQSYYIKIGQTAYRRLNSVVPSCFDVPSFYNLLAESFETLIFLLSKLAGLNNQDYLKHLLLGSDTSEVELLVNGISPVSQGEFS